MAGAQEVELLDQIPDLAMGEANIKVAVRFRPMLPNEQENLGLEHLGDRLQIEDHRVQIMVDRYRGANN